MSSPRHSTLQRGASVLAALVIAAALASVALLVQQGSPVAYTQSQTAEAGAAAAPTATKEKCNYEYDYKFTTDKEGKLQEEKTLFCQTNASQCKTENGKSVPSDQNRKSRIQACSASGTCTDLACDQASPVTEVGRKAVLDTSLDDLQNGRMTPTELTDTIKKSGLVMDAQDQQTLNDALSAQKESVAGDLQTYKDSADAMQKELDKLAANEPSLFKTCEGMSYASGCGDINDIKAQRDEAQKRVDELTQQTKELDAAQKSLTPGEGREQCSPATDPNCANVPAPTLAQRCESDNTQPGCPGYRATNGCRGANCGTGFDNKSNGQNANNGGGLGGMPKMGGGGGSGGGSGSGSGQQQQQQCQPQYQCSSNTVMYNSCPNLNQGSSWQTVQQCPVGYTCQNNGCVASAPYGYCSDGRTPRTAPAQPQPAASGCTGTWQDTSNACQQSWQCSGTATAGQPTAQLSCQPLTAASGTTITFAYVCANGATAAAATNFVIPSATTLSGTATTSIQKPTDGTNSVTYALSCTNANVSPALTASAQCAVQVGNAAIVLVATPEKIAKTETEDLKRKSTIGWVTSGMQSCVISSADFPDWTTSQAGNTSISGAAVSPIITADATFKLTCQTLGGTTASSTVKVLSI